MEKACGLATARQGGRQALLLVSWQQWTHPDKSGICVVRGNSVVLCVIVMMNEGCVDELKLIFEGVMIATIIVGLHQRVATISPP